MRLLHDSTDVAAVATMDDAALAEHYRHPLPEGRPGWLRTNFVASLDGSTQGTDGRSGSLNTPSALHRAHADVVLVGAETVRAEGYRAVDLAPWQRRLRAAEGLRPFPLLAVLTRSLTVDPTIATSGTAEVGPVLVVTTTGKSDAELAPFGAAGVDVVQLAGEPLDLGVVVEHLAAVAGPRVLCEGGARLHRDLLAADLVDEAALTLAPVMVGGGGRRTTAGEPLAPPVGFTLRSALHADDGALFLNYRRAR